jgi:hypothetical protein
LFDTIEKAFTQTQTSIQQTEWNKELEKDLIDWSVMPSSIDE